MILRIDELQAFGARLTILSFLSQKTRGSVRALQKSGGASGVASSAKEYAGNNSERLGGAAGSSVGMIAGAALLGPVGLVVGGVAGARAGAKAFQHRRSQQQQQQQQQQQNEAASAPQQVDLLDDSLSNMPTNHAPPGAAFNPALVEVQNSGLSDPFASSSSSMPASTNTAVSFEIQPPQQHSYHKQHRSQQYQQSNSPQQQQQQQQQYQNQPQTQQGYKFGDFSRRIVAKGKQKDGRSANDGYKFGDFSRGLFGRK